MSAAPSEPRGGESSTRASERPLIVARIEFDTDDFVPGDYVLATKYSDGDPGDQYAIGFYVGSYLHCGHDERHLVVDAEGGLFRYNGFRRIQHLSARRGNWLVAHMSAIEQTMFYFDEHGRRRGKSVWRWARDRMIP